MAAKIWYYTLAIASLAGTIIGVGMFGLPYTALQSGFFLTAAYLLVFGVIVGIMHLLYLEVTLRTQEAHRLTGYTGYYLGEKWKTVTFIQSLISLWGTLLVYTIVGAQFVLLVAPNLTGVLSETQIGIIFYLVCCLVVFKGDRSVGLQELLFTIPIVALIIIIFVGALASPAFSLDVLTGVQHNNWIGPYGITLFALVGFSIIPALEHILEPAKKRGIKVNYPFIVMTGTLLPAVLYVLFVLGVLGVSQQATSENALSGLVQPLGNTLTALGAVLGIFAMYTSFISVGNELQRTFSEDYKLNKPISFLGAMLIPFLLYLLNVRNFIAIADVVGALMGGYLGVIMVVLFWKAKAHGTVTPPFSVQMSRAWGYAFIAIFVFASLYAFTTYLAPLFSTSFAA